MTDLDVARGERAHVVTIHSDDPDDLTTSLFLARDIARDPKAHMFVIAHTQRFGGKQARAMRAKFCGTERGRERERCTQCSDTTSQE